MTLDAFLRSSATLLAVMALLSLVESVLPLARKPEWRRRHRLPNLALLGVTLGLYFALNAGALLVSVWLGAHGIGLLTGVALPPLALVAIGVVALDASTWVCHRLMHRLPPLWRAHRVHHADPLVDVTTALRQHPIEGLWRFVFVMAPAWALGIPAPAVAIYRVASAMQGLGEHVNVRLWEPLDQVLRLLVVTPNLHKLHHSRRAIETDSNYGNLFSLFDRAFGTFTPPSPGRCVDYGLDGYDAPEAQQLGALLRLPFRGSGGILAGAVEGELGAASRMQDATP